MQTKRKYAHELYPHPVDEWTVEPLHKAVPYLYAHALGREVFHTDWFDLMDKYEKGTDLHRLACLLSAERTNELIYARQIAFMADAMLQGLTGHAAWEWAEERSHPEAGELVYERAELYGVPCDQIKPYPVLDEPDHHDHYGPERPGGWRSVTRVNGKESECVECGEPDPVVAEDLFGEATAEPETTGEHA